MAVFNCSSSEIEEIIEFNVETQTDDESTGELTVTDSLKIKGVQGVSVAVEGDTVEIGIDPETFPGDLDGDSGSSCTCPAFYTANSVEELPDPATVPEGSIGLVPSKNVDSGDTGDDSGSDGSGLGLPVVELTTNIAVAASDNSSTETTLSEAEGEALYAAGGLGLPVIIKWSSDIFPFFSIANHCGALQFELNNIMSASDGTSFTLGMIYKIRGEWKFITWKKSF